MRCRGRQGQIFDDGPSPPDSAGAITVALRFILKPSRCPSFDSNHRRFCAAFRASAFRRAAFRCRMRFARSSSLRLVPGDTKQRIDVFLRDRWTGLTGRASVSSTREQGNDSSNTSLVSGDGGRVVFHSSATTLVAAEAHGARMDVSLNDTGGIAPMTSGSPAMAAQRLRAESVLDPLEDVPVPGRKG
jgi:hypothetical protein